MWKVVTFICVLGFMLWSVVFMLLPKVIPNFSRQGQKVLINGRDTAIIMKEEKPLPSFVKRKREVTVRYKDNLGIYHEESFAENEITPIN